MMILLALAAATAPIPLPQSVITNVSPNGILEWKADGNKGMWIRASTGKWHYATFMGGSCARLASASGLTFDTSPLNQFDNHSAIVAEGWRCPIVSLVPSDGPPKKRKG